MTQAALKPQKNTNDFPQMFFSNLQNPVSTGDNTVFLNHFGTSSNDFVKKYDYLYEH